MGASAFGLASGSCKKVVKEFFESGSEVVETSLFLAFKLFVFWQENEQKKSAIQRFLNDLYISSYLSYSKVRIFHIFLALFPAILYHVCS